MDVREGLFLLNRRPSRNGGYVKNNMDADVCFFLSPIPLEESTLRSVFFFCVVLPHGKAAGKVKTLLLFWEETDTKSMLTRSSLHLAFHCTSAQQTQMETSSCPKL